MNNLNNQIEIKTDNSNTYNNSQIEQYVVKRTEIEDILYFYEEESQSYNYFLKVFGNIDLESIFETSLFSVTLHDENINKPVALFIYNDSPPNIINKFDILKSSSNIWESWFYKFFDDLNLNLDGKNSLWLNYFCIIESYCLYDETLKKIFHRVHLSLYTTLPYVKGTFSLFSDASYKSVLEASERNENIQNNSNNDNNSDSNIDPFYTVNLLLKYIYDIEVPEAENANNDINIYVRLNLRDKIFHLIEIREATQEDHDDLENIFQAQTPPDVANSYEDFFIAKMIANEDLNKRVLVGQVNDKAVGMLAVSTDVDIEKLCKLFELEKYDNLTVPEYMKAVNYKRKTMLITEENNISLEDKKIKEDYEREVLSTEPISQRILLQDFTMKNNSFESIESLEKKQKNNKQKNLTPKTFAILYFLFTIKNFSLRHPNLDKYYDKVKIESGNTLLVDELSFYLDTLNYFGLPKGYLEGEGHWEDYIKFMEKKKKAKEARKHLIQNSSNNNKDNKTQKRVKKNNKDADDLQKKKEDFDYIPFDNAINLIKKADLSTRSEIRKIINQNKKLISNFFVNEKGEPSEARCFDINLLSKKLKDNKIYYNEELNNLFVPILTCFGDLQYDKVKTMRPQEHVNKIDVKDDKKKKANKDKNKKKDNLTVEEKKDQKMVEATMLLTSIGEFFEAVNKSFKYDKILYELELIQSDVFQLEYQEYKKDLSILEDNNNNNYTKYQSEYENIKNIIESKEDKECKEYYKKYKSQLENYNNYKDLPPITSNVLNAFCIKVFFIEQAFESRSTDFLLQAFDAFPDKDYMIVSQPHNYSENSLLEPFIRIPKKPDSLFPEVLYVLHKESMLIYLIKASYSTIDDLENSVYLFETVGKDANYLYTCCKEAIENQDYCKFYCVTLKINDNVIGICLVSKEININYYDTHFNISEFINLEKFSKYFHGRVLFFSLHKNFVQFSKIAFKEILRLINKFSLYYEIYSNMPLPSFAKDMCFCKNRKFPRLIIDNNNDDTNTFDEINNLTINNNNNNNNNNIHYSELSKYKQIYEDDKINTKMDGEERNYYDKEESEFNLMILTKRQLSDIKIANNNRIVVVGASDTGLSFIENLFSIRYLNFYYIYLIAPGGLIYHHIENEKQNLKTSYSSYELKEVKRLMLETRIKIIDSKMTDINRANKFISLEDGSVLYYDYLVMTLGLKERVGHDLETTIRANLNSKFIEQSKEIEKQIIENTNLINNQGSVINVNNSINNQNKGEGKDLRKEIQELQKKKQVNDANSKNLQKSLNFISVDNPRLYSIFSLNSKLLKSLKKDPSYELILYGRSLNLFCFIKGILERGISGHKLKLIIPTMNAFLSKEEKLFLNYKAHGHTNNSYQYNFSNVNPNLREELEFTNTTSLESSPEVETYLLELISKQGVLVLKDYNYRDVILNEFYDSIEGYSFCHMDNTEVTEIIKGNYIITGGMLNVDLDIFNIIHENGLVYNGRTIINKDFFTCDPNILAGGRLCEFSQQYYYIEKNKLLRLES